MGTPILSAAHRRLLDEARTATLATVASDGRPRLVPVCFALAPGETGGRPVIWTPLDEKPKQSTDPRGLARVRDILVLPEVTMLVDRWREEWTELAWLRLYGSGDILEPQVHERPEHASAVAHLREKYPQYVGHAIDTLPIIRVRVERVVSWEATPG